MNLRRPISAAVFAIAIAFAIIPTFADEGVMPIGTKLDGFSMKDPAGKEHSYKSLKGENGTLVIFLSAQCPVVAMYNDRINEVAAAYNPGNGWNYFPSVPELMITIGVIALEIMLYLLFIKKLPVLHGVRTAQTQSGG